MAAKKSRKAMAQINVVPYIDVMLVLLIIFMVTAPLLQQGVEVSLPQTTSQPLSQDQKDPLVVTVNAAGELYLNIGETPKAPVNEAHIRQLVGTLMQAEPDTPVLVKGDETVPYGRVVKTMALLQAAGAPKVGLVTDPELLN